MQLLKKAPLTEAVCEILFMPTPAFDNTLPGVLYTELKAEYPVKREKPANLISAPNLDNAQAVDFTAVAVSQFLSEDNTKAVQIGKDILVINMVGSSYKGWDVFRNEIIKVLKLYYQNFQEMPSMRRITLKYINNFVFDVNTDYSKVFNFSLPSPPVQKYQRNRAFQTLVEYDTEYGDILSLQFKSIFPPDPSKKSVILEINNHLLKPTSLDEQSFEKWLNCAHISIEDLFVASFKKVFFQTFK